MKPCQKFQDDGVIRHVLKRDTFADAKLFFEFYSGFGVFGHQIMKKQLRSALFSTVLATPLSLIVVHRVVY